jgi:hypothetical protein
LNSQWGKKKKTISLLLTMDSNNNSMPESFFCPLTHELMKDPVVDPEGNSYERSAIEKWLQTNATSPITRSPLSLGDLVPNRALRDAIGDQSNFLKR